MIDERIISLAELLGFDTGEKSASLAELKGYITAIKLICDDMKMLELQLSPKTACETAFDLFSNMFYLSDGLDTDERRQLIIDRFKLAYGDFEAGILKKKIREYGINCAQLSSRLILSTNSSTPTIIESGLLDDLAGIMKNYMSPMTAVYIKGGGYDFDLWDGTEYTFDGYDRLDLPFYILDDLK